MASESQELGPLSRALGRQPDEVPDLNERPRPWERAIRWFLFACGILSIFTTIGIVVGLGNESLLFFSRTMWEGTNKPLSAYVDASATTLELGTEGARLDDAELIRIGDEQMAVERYEQNYISVDIVGSGAGLRRFCSGEGEVDIANASRAITEEERATCEQNGLEPVEFLVGVDAVSIVANEQTAFVQDVTFDELRAIFSTAENWSDVREEWPDEPIQRFIPGTDSGTFDFFAEAVFDDAGEAMLAADPNTSENDDQLVGSIRRNDYSIGFFGLAYFRQNASDLHAVSIEGYAPNIDNAQNGDYPLARPLYLYSDPDIMRANPEVAAFINFYLTHVDDEIERVGYAPASEEALDQSRILWLEVMGEEGESDEAGQVVLPEVDPLAVSGNIATAGSSTVGPLTEHMGEVYAEAGYRPRLVVERGVNGTEATEHQEGAEVRVGEGVTLFQFFNLQDPTWSPQIGEFSVIPLVNATLMTSLVAMLVAIPFGLGSAIYLSEYAPEAVRRTLKPILEILAGIPTVVYGYFALTFMTPLLRGIFGADVVNIYNTASAGIVVGILLIPYMASTSEDALNAVPNSLREASFGLGATRLETTLQVVIPAALSGILAAFIISVSRAIGETMIVAIAAGAGPNFTFNVFESAETMTGHIARISGGDLSYDSIDYNSLFAIGLTLFLVTLLLNILSRTVTARFREEY